MADELQDRRGWGVIALVAVSVVSVFGLVLAPAANDYFFLFDDYKLVGQALELPTWMLAVQPHFHYFRPLVHLVLSLEAMAFGWSSPWGYAWAGLLCHIVNSGLLGTLLWRVGWAPWRATAAAGLFCLAPWPMEALFWASCRFELLACCVMLAASHVAWSFSNEPGRPGLKVLFGLLVLASCLCKETAAAAWVGVLLGGQCATGQWRSLSAGRLRPVLWSALALYLGLRFVVMVAFAGGDPLGGHRGNVVALLLGSGTLSNLGSHLQSLVLPMLPDGANGLHLAYGAVMLLGVAGGLRGAMRASIGALLAASMALLPALWIAREPSSLAGGRLLYLPGLFLVVMVSYGWSCAVRDLPWRRACFGGLFAIAVAICGLSAHQQARVWRSGYAVARAAMHEYAALDVPAGPRHITNMPFVMREGPYLLKPYAFVWYGGRRTAHTITATPSIYEMASDGARPLTRWAKRQVDVPRGAHRIELKFNARGPNR
ncbi:MAG: hypothetical protein ACPGU1_07425 [Myxococcota bacterium]